MSSWVIYSSWFNTDGKIAFAIFSGIDKPQVWIWFNGFRCLFFTLLRRIYYLNFNCQANIWKKCTWPKSTKHKKYKIFSLSKTFIILTDSIFYIFTFLRCLGIIYKVDKNTLCSIYIFKEQKKIYYTIMFLYISIIQI